jgi:hypothetical protein
VIERSLYFKNSFSEFVRFSNIHPKKEEISQIYKYLHGTILICLTNNWLFSDLLIRSFPAVIHIQHGFDYIELELQSMDLIYLDTIYK